MEDLILNYDYIKWIEEVTSKYKSIDDDYFLKNNKGKLSEKDILYIDKLKDMFNELAKYSNTNESTYLLKYNDVFYRFSHGRGGFSCSRSCGGDNYTDYSLFRRSYKKNMNDIFNELNSTVNNSLNNTDLDRVNHLLSSIDGATLVTGVGGSNVVSDFASKVLNQKNNIITKNSNTRDLLYMNLNGYNNVLSCSYSGNNYGVKMSFDNDLNHYLFTAKNNNLDGVTNIKYDMDNEDSFISLGATLVPCSVLLNYYLDGNNESIREIGDYKYDFDTTCDCFEIFSGYDTSVLSNYLESTITEAGIGVPIVHDKYSYCHGRSTLSTIKNNIAIYFNKDTDLDKLMLQELPKYYKNVIKIDVSNGLEGEYKALVESMYLTKYLADKSKKDLALVDYNPIVKKLYYFKKSL